MPKPVQAKLSWDDALELWREFLKDQPYGRRLQAWNMLQQRGSLALGYRASERVNWPDVLLALQPEDFMHVMETLQ